MMNWRSLILFAIGAGLVFFSITPAVAQEASAGLEAESGLSVRVVQLFMLVTVLSMAPGIAMMITCLPFMVIVFSILRQAIGLQQSPPNMMIMSLALFMTYFVMEPVFSQAWSTGVQPLMENSITEKQAIDRVLAPFQEFMTARVSPGAISALAEVAPDRYVPGAQPPMSVLVPAFMLSEIQNAFQVGFVIFLPFLIIDLIVASVLMAMGMMMVPPALVSLPFKLAFFVLANGWIEIAGAVVKGYGV